MSTKEVRRLVSEHFREPTVMYHLEPQIPALAKPVVVCVDVVGARITKSQNPHIPVTPKEIARECIESINAGAAIAHIHVRDEHGSATEDPAMNKEVWDMVFAEVHDVVTSNHIMYDRTARGLDMFRGYIDPLVKWDGKYLQTAAVVTTDFCEPRGKLAYNISDEELTELCAYLEDHGVKPELQMYSPSSMERIKHALFKDGKPRVKGPMWINIHLGKHHSVPVVQDPWSFLSVITWFSQIKADMAGVDLRLGIYIGGRNWLPLTTLAIMLGADVVRVGMEDSLYVYPHRDELISSNRSVVEKTIAIAKELGRPIATVAETRQILGIATPAFKKHK